MKRLKAMFALWLSSSAFQAAAAEPVGVDFAHDVRPILERSCGKCHGPEKQKGGLRFDLRGGALREGDSGSKAITPGHADESELIRRIESTDADERMPPKGDGLSRDDLKVLRSWIDQGANWPEAACFCVRSSCAGERQLRAGRGTSLPAVYRSKADCVINSK